MTSRRTSIGGQFAPHTIEMLRSPAWRALSLSARRVLDRIEIELADHGGADNGKLPIPYDDFHAYGIHRHAVAPAIREAAALGFIEVTERGRAGNAEFRRPNSFRLTYRPTKYSPTDEWRKITEETAEAIARSARSSKAPKIKIQCRKTPNVGDGNRHRKRQFHSAETVTTAMVPETITTLDISGGDALRQEGMAMAAMSEVSLPFAEAIGWRASAPPRSAVASEPAGLVCSGGVGGKNPSRPLPQEPRAAPRADFF
jgi:hypothetical protein